MNLSCEEPLQSPPPMLCRRWIHRCPRLEISTSQCLSFPESSPCSSKTCSVTFSRILAAICRTVTFSFADAFLGTRATSTTAAVAFPLGSRHRMTPSLATMHFLCLFLCLLSLPFELFPPIPVTLSLPDPSRGDINVCHISVPHHALNANLWLGD